MSWMKSKGFWNLPNTITVGRVVLVPLMVVLLWDVPSALEWKISFVVFVGAMLTDIVDGWLARKWDLQSPAGAYLDPLADKLMVGTTLIMLVPLGYLPAWLVALLIARESAITGLRGIASQEGMVISASTLGKFKTAYQGTALGFVLYHEPLFGMNPPSTGLFLLYISTFFSLISAAEYLYQFFKLSSKKVLSSS